MKVHYIFNILILPLLFLTSCSKKHNELSEVGLKGNVQSIREISYSATETNDTIIKGDIVYSEDLKNYFATYNQDGNLTEIINYDNTNTVIDRWKFLYSSDGKALGGNYYLNDNTLSDSTYYVYNKKGYVTEYYHYFADGKLKNKIYSFYDRKGNITEEKLIDADNMLYRTTKCYYKHKNLIKDSSFDAAGNLLYTSSYIYNNKDCLIKQTIFNGDGKINSQGTYSYNENGDIEESYSEIPGQKPVKYYYTYKYDSCNNWIQKITFINNSAVFLTVRQIYYYK